MTPLGVLAGLLAGLVVLAWLALAAVRRLARAAEPRRKELAPMTSDDGRAVYTGLIKPMEDGSLMVGVIVVDAEFNDARRWSFAHFRTPEAKRFAQEIDRDALHAILGGSAPKERIA